MNLGWLTATMALLVNYLEIGACGLHDIDRIVQTCQTPAISVSAMA